MVSNYQPCVLNVMTLQGPQFHWPVYSDFYVWKNYLEAIEPQSVTSIAQPCNRLFGLSPFFLTFPTVIAAAE